MSAKLITFKESDGGKSFHKIGYVIVDLSCFVASGFVRCRRRYLLKGYDGNRRRAGKRQDNSLLVVSFTCQQNFGKPGGLDARTARNEVGISWMAR
ncbi:hypothetical protein ACTXT7_008847 [Hymenolepis weldensis]